MDKLWERLTHRKAKHLHASIQAQNIEEVEENIKNTFVDSHVFINNESAVAVALRLRNLDIYKLLIQNGFQLGPAENFGFIVEDFDDKEKLQLRRIHFESSKNPTDYYQICLMTKCKLIHTSSDEVRRDFYSWIGDVFKKLTAIAEISPLLEIVTFSDSLKLIFDFNRDSIDDIDPTTDDSAKGITYLISGKILIGAKGLVSGDKDQEKYVMGVIAHEICHYAMHSLFENEAKPYLSDDAENREKFQKILERCEALQHEERIIELVFQYNERFHHAELIVRVPNILAFYSGKEDYEKLKEVKKTFAVLFDFYKNKVLEDLKKEMPKIPAKKKVREANEVCGLMKELERFEFPLKPPTSRALKSEMKKHQVFSSNCIRLTMKAIFDALKDQKQLDEKIFMKFENFKNTKITKMIVDAENICEDLKVLVSCDGEDSKTIQEFMEKVGDGETFYFFVPKSEEFNKTNVKQIDHLWSDMTDESQKMLLKTAVDFQGAKIESFEALNVGGIELVNLNDLLDRREIKIGDELDENPKIHIERKFLKSKDQMSEKSESENPLGIRFNEIFNRNEKTVLVVAAPGSGKTTEFKFIASELKVKSPDHWIVYLDLKKYTDSFQKDGSVSVEFIDSKAIAEFLARKVLKLETLDAKVFTDLFVDGRVKLLFDGVDEISPSFKEFVVKLMIAIKEKSENQLWIATRPHLLNELEKNLATKAFMLLNFTKDDRQEYFMQSFKSHANRDEIFAKIDQVLQRIEYRYHNHFVHPMMLQMIADLFKEDPSFQPSDTTLYSIYDDFVSMFYGKILKKALTQLKTRKDS